MMETVLHLNNMRAGQKQQLKQIKALYKQAFPKAERKPFFLMQKKQREGSMEIWSIEDEKGEFVGLAIMVLYRDLALLDYFAIAPEKREGGMGSKAFQMLKKQYGDKRFFIEIESPKIESYNREQRIRRKAFYIKNGMAVLPFMVKLFGIEMEILADNCTLDFEEYSGIYRDIFGRFISRNVQLYQIPENF